MVERGDVLLENFAPGVMERLGVGWEVLHRINPRLVYASGSGYGLTGPDRDNLAMDLTIQAVSGLIAETGFADGPPVKAGPAVVDFISGIHLYAATLTALFERERTGRGRLVEVAMQEAAYATLTSQLHAYFETGTAPPRTGNASHGRVPLNVYPTKDGYVAMNIAVEEHWHNLLRAMGREDLRDDPLCGAWRRGSRDPSLECRGIAGASPRKPTGSTPGRVDRPKSRHGRVASAGPRRAKSPPPPATGKSAA